MPSASRKRNAHESSTSVAGGRPGKKVRRGKRWASNSRADGEDTDESQGEGGVDGDGDDSDDEENEEDAGNIYGTAVGHNIHTDNLLDFRQLKHSIDLEDALDLREPLGRRAHLERLIEARWQSLYRRQRQDQRETGTDAAENDEDDEVQMIVQHLSSSVVPYALRWPLPVSEVPQPSWSLADELCSIVERAVRARQRTDKRSNVRRSDDDDDVEQSDDEIDEPAPSLVLPAIARCQAVLNGTLHRLAHRILPSGGQIHARRRDVITWRDILKTVEMQDSVPSEVLTRTEARLRSIFGSSEVVPAAAIVSTFGTSNWRRNRLRAALMDEEAIDERLCEFHQLITRKRARRQGNNGKVEAELLLRKPSHALLRRLQDPPKPRRQFFHEAREPINAKSSLRR